MDEAEIAGWTHQRLFGTNTGIVCGRVVGIDIDSRDPAIAGAVEDEIRDWCDGRGDVLVRFGHAPKRLIPLRTEAPFSKMACTLTAANDHKHKIEILGQGQQFVAFGTHPDTKRAYAWQADRSPASVPVSELPETDEGDIRKLLAHLVDMLIERHGLTRDDGVTQPIGLGSGAPGPLDVDAALAALHYGSGTFNNTLLCCSGALMGRGMQVDDIRDKLMAAARNAVAGNPACADWDWAEEERTILGMCYRLVNKSPEMLAQVPELLQQQWHAREAADYSHLQIKFAGIGNGMWTVYGRKPHSPAATAGTPDTPAASPALPKKPVKIHAIPFVAFDEAKLRPRAFLYARHYQRGQATATIGCDGAGKSTVGIAEAIALATGRALLGEPPAERCRVWVHNADDNNLEIKRRVAACCRLHGVNMVDLEGWLFVTGKDDFTIRVASGNSQLVIDHATVASIVGTIVDNQIDVFIADPLVTLHSVAENDNVRMSEVIHIFGDIAARCDCAIDVCHHTRKPSNGDGEKEFNSDDSRGASAVRAAVRASRVFNRMSKAEANSAGLSEEDRVFYIRIDRGKANYLPPATKATWFQLKSVQLLNAEQVGAIAPWAFPGQDVTPSPERTATDKAAEHVFLSVLRRFNDSERPASDRKGANYAPTLFADEREAKAAKLSTGQLKAAMLRLLADGRVCPKDERHGWQRTHTLVPAE